MKYLDLPNVFGIADDILVWAMKAVAKTMTTRHERYYKYTDR